MATETRHSLTQNYSRNAPITIGVIMDSLEQIKTYKDTTIGLIMSAQQCDWMVKIILPGKIVLKNGQPWGWAQSIYLHDISGNTTNWYELGKTEFILLADLDVILLRKDPPFNMEFIYTTYFLDLAEQAGVLVINKPQSVRDCNEKFFACHFPQCCPPTLVTSSAEALRSFRDEHQNVVLKPLDGMGGEGVFVLKQKDRNFNVVVESLTHNEQTTIMAQLYIPEITSGDKRVFIINGETIKYGLTRIPAADENRANIVAGGIGQGSELTAKDLWICKQLGPELKRRGLIFVGLDIIGEYLTEINVTSPTGTREIYKYFGHDIAVDLTNYIKKQLATS